MSTATTNHPSAFFGHVKETPETSPAESQEDSSSVDTDDALLDMLGLPQESSEPLSSVISLQEEIVQETNSSPSSKRLVAVPIDLPSKCSRYRYKDCAAATVENFFSQQECERLVQLAQQSSRGFQYITKASHMTPDGETLEVPLQNPNPHKLAVFENERMRNILWKRLETSGLLQQEWLEQFVVRSNSSKPRHLNPRLRVLQYDAQDNDRFEPHFDATTHVDNKYVSKITVLLYLNSGGGVDFEGGETVFMDAHISDQMQGKNINSTGTNHATNSQIHITPRLGQLVMFEHDLYHSGAPLIWGTKHVMRTDILFDDDDNDDDGQGNNSTYEGEEEGSHENTESMAPTSSLLVQDLCDTLNWTPDEQACLNEIGVLNSTLETLLMPGTTLITTLLCDLGIPNHKVSSLLSKAQEHIR